MSDNRPCLFQPLTLRNLKLKNRIVISPMCQHAGDGAGSATPWHLVHLGKFALGGAALVFTESAAVSPEGRIGVADLGLWDDHNARALRPVAEFVKANGAAFGVQLGHAGRKAGSEPLWEGGRPLPAERMVFRGRVWPRLGPTAEPAGPDWGAPTALDHSGIHQIVTDFAAAAARADAIGADVLELHFGHGYLVASFLSPQANRRTDEYGGSRDNRMRLALDIVEAVRHEWPGSKPLFVRLSVVDGAAGGWDVDDSVALARRLTSVGVDVIDCSSGGLTETTRALPIPRGLSFQVPYAAAVRREASVATQAVGMILDGEQAEAILQAGYADLIAIGRSALHDPYWPLHAAETMGADLNFEMWPERHGAWLAKRQPLMRRLGRDPRPVEKPAGKTGRVQT